MNQYEKARQYTKMFRVPDRWCGLETPWWKHLLQRYVTRRP